MIIKNNFNTYIVQYNVIYEIIRPMVINIFNLRFLCAIVSFSRVDKYRVHFATEIVCTFLRNNL